MLVSKAFHNTHFIKCLNCQGEHQADLYDCPFWKHHFNKK